MELVSIAGARVESGGASEQPQRATGQSGPPRLRLVERMAVVETAGSAPDGRAYRETPPALPPQSAPVLADAGTDQGASEPRLRPESATEPADMAIAAEIASAIIAADAESGRSSDAIADSEAADGVLTEPALSSADRLASLIREQRELLASLSEPTEGTTEVAVPVQDRGASLALLDEATLRPREQDRAVDEERPPMIIMRAQATATSMVVGDARFGAQDRPAGWPAFVTGMALSGVAGWAVLALLGAR